MSRASAILRGARIATAVLLAEFVLGLGMGRLRFASTDRPLEILQTKLGFASFSSPN
jgi:hypothetical protein